MNKHNSEIRFFEDLHALAHIWAHYCREDREITFEAYLRSLEPERYKRLLEVYHAVQGVYAYG